MTVNLDGSVISIHAPREGSDRGLMDKYGVPVEFQSTLPVRGATWQETSS